jgi:sialidase-1
MIAFLTLAASAFAANAAEQELPKPVPVFEAAKDGFASIRIPAIVASGKGTLLAFAEGRAANSDQAKNKIVLKRSTDGGATWDKVQVIAADGDKALNNPCAVLDRKSGEILLMYQSYPAGVGERSGKIEPGYEGENVVRNWLITSADDGATWSKPRDVSRETKREKVVTTLAGGPGIGIQLRHGKHAGRILFPFNEGPFGVWNIYAVYSDDAGKTWKMGEPAPGAQLDNGKGKPTSLVNEAQFVELSDGSIRFNVRRWAGKAVRKTCVSTDGGVTWSKVEDVPDLIDPGCMASVLSLGDATEGGKGRIVYSGPQSTKRENGTIALSNDDGKTWPVKRVLRPEGFAYSCLVALPGGAFGCLYEINDSKTIVFQRLTLDWLNASPKAVQPTSAFSLPVVDLDAERNRHAVIDREAGQYLGHPTTLLLEDGKTVLCVYPRGHGRGPILYKRSEDGGKTWSERLPTPKNWETSLETPTIHRVVDAQGKKRIVLFSGLYPVRMAVSDDDGKSWSDLRPVGDWGGIVAMASLIELKTGAGHYMAFFHDDGRFFKKGGKATSTSTVYKTLSNDGGVSWSEPEVVFRSNAVFLCEPGAIRSPDGKQIALLLRENFHKKNSHVTFSDDEGATWTEPRELAASLNGDRHVAKYGPDGRLLISFRDIPTKGQFSPTAGDWVGWVGTYDDLRKGTEGQYRIRFRKNYGNSTNASTGDCGYPGIELLPDGNFLAVSYGHWDVVPGSTHPQHPEGRGQPPYIVGVRFPLKETDAILKKTAIRPEK